MRFSKNSGVDGSINYLCTLWMALLQFEPSGASPSTPLMKILFVVKGVARND